MRGKYKVAETPVWPTPFHIKKFTALKGYVLIFIFYYCTWCRVVSKSLPVHSHSADSIQSIMVFCQTKCKEKSLDIFSFLVLSAY